MSEPNRSKSPPNRYRLNDRFVKTVEPAEKRTLYWDTVQQGLVLCVEPTGHKSYKLIYSMRGRPRWFAIGCVTGIGLKEARQVAREKRAAVGRGIDVQAERAASRRQATFEELAHRYVEEHAKRRNKSWRQADTLVRRYLIPRWRNLHCRDITRTEVRSVFNTLTDGGAPVLANQVLAAGSAVFSWAMKNDIADIESNPCHGIERNPTKPRERVLSERELPLVWNALDDVGLIQGRALRMILVTGQRPGEVTHMRQQDLDIGEHRFTDNGGGSYVAHGGWWTLPGAPDPSAGWPGTKNGQTHRVWLSPPALQILDDLAIDNVQLVFAGPRGTPVRQQVCRELRLNSPARPHDLRRTHGTLTTSLGFSRDQMNRLQNHHEGGIASVYDRHGYAHEARLVQEAVAARVVALLGDVGSGNAGPFGRKSDH
jgi:integrase